MIEEKKIKLWYRPVVILLILILGNNIIRPQSLAYNPIYYSESFYYLPHNSVKKQKKEKNYWLPAVEVIGLNLTVLFYNNYQLLL